MEEDNEEITFSEIVGDINKIEQQLKKVVKKCRKLKKLTINREKEYKKNLLKQTRRAQGLPDRPRSGIHQPMPVSDELCNFMNKSKGTKIARTDVTVYINQYIKANKLQNQVNKKEIIPNETLKKLLRLEDDQKFTWFEIPKKINHNFIKNKD